MTTTTSEPRVRQALFAGMLLLASGTAAAAVVTDTFRASYDVSRGPVGLGQTTFSLEPGDRAGCYVYTGEADPNAVVSMFLGDVSDVSRFCITDSGALRPQYFRHHEDGNAKDSYTLTFDWDAGTVRYESEAGAENTMTLPEQAVDPLSIQIAARLWLARADAPADLPDTDFTLVEENEIEPFRLSVSTGGTIEVPAGRYDTLQVTQIDEDGEGLRFWLARSAAWIPVRVEHESDIGVIRMDLMRLER